MRCGYRAVTHRMLPAIAGRGQSVRWATVLADACTALRFNAAFALW
jgi:hypothetical protein